MATVSANVTKETHIAAKHAAVDAGVSLRDWAGKAIDAFLVKNREQLRAGNRMPKRALKPQASKP